RDAKEGTGYVLEYRHHGGDTPKRLVRAQPRHPRADCRSLDERGGMMSDDVILRRLPYPASY
ncbi:hypothetical protein V4B65_25395, partial [Klebsiella quasipneumoniae]|uniref:hypothetical protein n=1 Tax=Klebsiella quasipneumoniae TaxID=1463165 RepID=UPI002F95BB25